VTASYGISTEDINGVPPRASKTAASVKDSRAAYRLSVINSNAGNHDGGHSHAATS
jgi:hypothetical protein